MPLGSLTGWNRLSAGPLNKYVSIKRDIGNTYDSRGQLIETEQEVVKVWATIEPLRGQEGILARQLNAAMSHRVVIRWSSEVEDINPQWWIEWNDRILNIIEARNIEERNHTIELICAERL